MKAFDRRFCSPSDGILLEPYRSHCYGRQRDRQKHALPKKASRCVLLFIEMPASGHVNPALPVVQELVRRGEHITYYATEEFRYPQPSTIHSGHKRIRRTFTSYLSVAL
jgi:hypothetical protein